MMKTRRLHLSAILAIGTLILASCNTVPANRYGETIRGTWNGGALSGTHYALTAIDAQKVRFCQEQKCTTTSYEGSAKTALKFTAGGFHYEFTRVKNATRDGYDGRYW
jgi:hypothetical protein